MCRKIVHYITVKMYVHGGDYLIRLYWYVLYELMYWSLKPDHFCFVDIIIGYGTAAHNPPNSAADRIILA